MELNDISKICVAKCRTDLELSVENVTVMVKGVLGLEIILIVFCW